MLQREFLNLSVRVISFISSVKLIKSVKGSKGSHNQIWLVFYLPPICFTVKLRKVGFIEGFDRI